MISIIDKVHVLLHLANEKDYLHAWTREGTVIASYQFKLFNWSINFHVKIELALAAQWIYLPKL